MTVADIGSVPIGHQGEAHEVRQRIADLGSSAMLAFDGEQHVGQLQFRCYEPGIRSPQGLWDPLYWADFEERDLALPERTLAVFCFHVGQLNDSDDCDPRYQGRGIGVRLLDHDILRQEAHDLSRGRNARNAERFWSFVEIDAVCYLGQRSEDPMCRRAGGARTWSWSKRATGFGSSPHLAVKCEPPWRET